MSRMNKSLWLNLCLKEVWAHSLHHSKKVFQPRCLCTDRRGEETLSKECTNSWSVNRLQAEVNCTCQRDSEKSSLSDENSDQNCDINMRCLLHQSTTNLHSNGSFNTVIQCSNLTLSLFSFLYRVKRSCNQTSDHSVQVSMYNCRSIQHYLHSHIENRDLHSPSRPSPEWQGESISQLYKTQQGEEGHTESMLTNTASYKEIQDHCCRLTDHTEEVNWGSVKSAREIEPQWPQKPHTISLTSEMNDQELTECKKEIRSDTVTFRQELSQATQGSDQGWELSSHSVQNRLYRP